MNRTEYEVRVNTFDNTSRSYDWTRRFDTVPELVDVIEWMITQLHTEADRAKARLILQRRLQHPEIDANNAQISHHDGPVIHPKSGGRLAAHDGGPVCVCGNRRSSHDIDGQRNDCDGYVEAQ